MTSDIPDNAQLVPPPTGVVMYGTRTCPFCAMAAQLLRSRSIEFTWVDVAGRRDLRERLLQLSGQSTVPQVFIGGASIGGFRELRSLDASGELRERVLEST